MNSYPISPRESLKSRQLYFCHCQKLQSFFIFCIQERELTKTLWRSYQVVQYVSPNPFFCVHLDSEPQSMKLEVRLEASFTFCLQSLTLMASSSISHSANNNKSYSLKAQDAAWCLVKSQMSFLAKCPRKRADLSGLILKKILTKWLTWKSYLWLVCFDFLLPQITQFICSLDLKAAGPRPKGSLEH